MDYDEKPEPGDRNLDAWIAGTKRLEQRLAEATARAERAERERDELRDDRARAFRIGDDLTLDTQTCEEMAASLVEMARKARGERDALAAEAARMREKAAKVRAEWPGYSPHDQAFADALNDLLNALGAKGE